MNAPGLEKFLTWLLNHSLQAGALVLFVLLVQRVFRRQLTHRWRFALWWIVLARLVLPFGPESALSLFNYFRPAVSLAKPQLAATPPLTPPPDPSTRAGAARPLHGQPAADPSADNSNPFGPAWSPPPGAEPAADTATVPASPTRSRDSLATSLALVWFGGVLALSACVLVQVLRFRFRLRRAAAAPDDATALLNACRRESGVARRLQLLETDVVRSPALFGLFRLRLLLPRGLAARFSPAELRYVFLHELAHVKRGDLWLNWLVTALQIMHWFNPFLWFGFARLRADRELACDELTLLCAGEKVGTSYGETVIKLLEGLGRPAAIPGLVGILEDKAQMKRRISMIANFRRPGRWSALAVVLLMVVAVAALTDAQTNRSSGQRIRISSDRADMASTNSSGARVFDPYLAVENRPPSLLATNSATVVNLDSNMGMYRWEVDGQDQLESRWYTSPPGAATNTVAGSRPDLAGTVHARGGAPLPATVFVATAAPKTGTSTFCPSCYADCRKNTTADAQGRFLIESLDPQLTFQVLAVAKGYRPKFVPKVDPAKGAITVELDPIEAGDATPDRSLRGRVVDVRGAPIRGAVVEMFGIQRQDGTGGWGSFPGIDPLAVTDERGEFLITAKEPFEGMDVTVKARAFSDRTFARLASNSIRHQLVMTEGATLTGRVLFDGRPVPFVEVGVSGVERGVPDYAGHFEIGTGTNGAFAFLNLPPDTDYYLYGSMNTLKSLGAIPIRKIHVGKDGEITGAGDVLVTPAHRLAGRVVLSDGASIPPNTRLLVSRQGAWDSMQLTLEQDGSFDTTGIPSETVSLSVRVKGYGVSGRNASLDTLNPFQLVGRMDRGITNLVYLLEKGGDPQPDYGSQGPESEWPRYRPLRGAEDSQDHSREWTVSGRALDSETKQPVEHFRVTPGAGDQFDRVSWNAASFAGTNGVYLAYVSKRAALPLLKVEADGYLPASATVLPRDTTQLDFALKKGSGPSGTVLAPDGRPAAGVSLVLLCDGNDQVSLSGKGELNTYWNRALNQRTDSNGRFGFQPALGMKSVAAASSNGFAVVAIESLAANPAITLEPFGRITGTLRRTSGPGANKELDVAFVDPDRFLPRINLQHHALTDDQGRFEFQRVPPGHLRLSYRVPISENSRSWRNVSLQEIELKPGQQLSLNVETSDRPPPTIWELHRPPETKRIPGAEINGLVLAPGGRPAANAQVALQVKGKYLTLGKASVLGNGPDDAAIVRTGPDGSFRLPLFENARSVLALNDEGFANVTADGLKTSPHIRLEKWGQIEGTLQSRGQPVVDARVSVRPTDFIRDGVTYDPNAFQASTDERGRFVVTFVPPGERSIAQLISTGPGSWVSRSLGSVEVKAGETVHFELNAIGRAVIGKVKLAQPDPEFRFTGATVSLRTPSRQSLTRMQLLSEEQREAYRNSEEYMAERRRFRIFPGVVSPDRSFRIEDVPPGSYEVILESYDAFDPFTEASRQTVLRSTAEAVVGVEGADRDSPVDLGTVEFKAFAFPAAAPQRADKDAR